MDGADVRDGDALGRLPIREAIDRAVTRAEGFELTISEDGAGGRISASIKVGYYFGLMAWDKVSTEYSGGNEIDPLPWMGTPLGRTLGMGAIAGLLTLAENRLVAGGHRRTAKALRLLCGFVLAGDTTWSMGWQRAWYPGNLIPSQWQRGADKPKDYSYAGQSQQTQREYDACKFLASHPAKHLASARCWK